MSKIGKKPIEIPQSFKIRRENEKLYLTGPKGELSISIRPELVLVNEKNQIILKRKNDSKLAKSLHGLTRTLINNMVLGLTDGFSKKLKIIGTGFRAKIENKELILSVGFSHPVKIIPPAGIEFNVKDNLLITISGADKQLVGEVAAKIRQVKPPDPYKGKGIRYIDEIVRKKAGKAAKTITAAS